jgi:carbon-monoxide dehydrogenase large subunit
LRREDARFLSGSGRYVGDVSMPGQLYAAFRRSDVARARLRAVSVEDARTSDGVHAVVTADDFPDAFGTLEPVVSYSGRDGMKLITPERPVLARGEVRFVGEEIAVVLADAPQRAVDAAERITVDYDELPACIGFDAALGPGAELVHDAIPGNVCFHFEYGDERATRALLEDAACRVALTLDSPRVSASPIEPRSVLAWYDGGRKTYEICCSNQGADLMGTQLAALLRTTRDRIRVHPIDVGGAFGPRAGAYPEYAVLLELARRLGRPIKWTSTRSEDFLCDSHGRAIRIAGEIGADVQGRFLALRTEWLCDQGAYLTYAGARSATINGCLIGAGPYEVRALHGSHRLVMTNSAPTDAYRGAGRPEAALIVERLVDEVAFRLGMDPLEIRRRNAIPKDAFPYRTLTGSVLDSGDYAGLLEQARSNSRWDGFAGRSRAARSRNALRGIGCALFVEPCGGGFTAEDQVALTVESQSKVFAHVAMTSNGQGHETVFPEIVARKFGIDPSRIVLRSGDRDGPLIVGNGTISSRSMLAQGSALSRAADVVIEKGKRIAADTLEAAVPDIDFAAGRYRVRGTDLAISFDEVLQKSSQSRQNPLDTVFAQAVPRAFTSGAHIAEVEIDRETGETTLVSYVAVDDIGTVINPVLAHGQIHGGVVQGAGQVFGERCFYDISSGQLLTGSFMDYPMPRADSVPPIASDFRPTPSPTNVLGAKGAGETGATGALAALTNAIADALRSAGAEPLDMPATPLRIWQTLQRTRG